MKIIAGRFRGFKITSPKGLKLRPTANIVRQALFNVIASKTHGSVVLDLFAGSGAFGFEALSRGASRVVFVDSSPVACEHIRRLAQQLELTEQTQILNMSAMQAVKILLANNDKFSVIFLDPPYYSDLMDTLFRKEKFTQLLADEGLIIHEGSARSELQSEPSGLSLSFSRKYGETVVNMYSLPEASQ